MTGRPDPWRSTSRLTVLAIGDTRLNSAHVTRADPDGTTTIRATAPYPLTITHGTTVYLRRPDGAEAILVWHHEPRELHSGETITITGHTS